MSTVAGPYAPAEPAAAPAGARARPRAGWAWARVLLACAALAASGGARLWQERQVRKTLESGRACPFPLKELPETLGPWKATDDRVLDPEVARNAGTTDSIQRTYVDERTGVQIGVLVLYGPAAQMFIHAPTLCYPGAGYALLEGPSRRVVEFAARGGGPRRAEFDTLVYAKGEGPAAERKQVTYAWGCDGAWSPDTKNPKYYQRVPGLFKVHVDRRAAPGEGLDADNPSESFLKELMPAIEARLPRPGPAAASPSPPASTAPR